MRLPLLPNLTILLITVLCSLALTRLMIALAHRYHWVVRPKADRWHQTPTALFGGVAIFGAFAIGCPLLLQHMGYQTRSELLGLILGGILIFVVGLRDDSRPLNPLVKMLGQIMAVTPFLIGCGLANMKPLFLFSIPLLVLWMLALTNAFNLLDNMDGLSAGTSVIIGGVLAVYAFLHGSQAAGMLSALVSAACLGFLAFNFRAKGPAHIFMGDCGSMFLGYMLAGLAVIGISDATSDLVARIGLPILIMALPIFDTTLVIIIRKREGRAISQGGRDHSSHRLVYAGLPDKKAVLLLYIVSLLAGAAALALTKWPRPFLPLVSVMTTAIALTWFGVFLSRFTGPPKTDNVSPSTSKPALDPNPS